jgi:hypothetical protein
MPDTWNCRDFVKSSSLAALSTLYAPAAFSFRRNAKSRGKGEVVLARDPKATDGLNEIDETIVQRLVDNGIRYR